MKPEDCDEFVFDNMNPEHKDVFDNMKPEQHYVFDNMKPEQQYVLTIWNLNRIMHEILCNPNKIMST